MMQDSLINTSVIILAAGTSGRMGFPKPLLRFNQEESFIEHIARVYIESGISDLIVVVNPLLHSILIRRKFQFLSESKLIINSEPERDRIHSVRLGLEAAKPGNFCFIQNADQPFVDEDLICVLRNVATEESYVSPKCGEINGHPILLGSEVIKKILESETKCTTLRDLLQPYKCIRIPVENEKISVNINNLEDYKNIFGRNPEVL
jgi:molybdenum cofactor cytidylyltransferase